VSLCVDAEKIKHVNVAFLAGELNLMATGQALELSYEMNGAGSQAKREGGPSPSRQM
jgi:hypothetical protein